MLTLGGFMEKIIKKVAAIHDLSGFGRSSLTNIIPILSTMGIQVCPLPTAILSTHTGGFTDFSFIDLTDNMEKMMEHWSKLDLEFDCIYSGFLGSHKQIDIVSRFIDRFGHKNNLVVIDPVLGDSGELYSTMGCEMVEEMKKLITKADIITPNFTEVCLLLDKEYVENIDEEIVKNYLIKLANMGPKIVIATSVPENETILNEKYSNVIAYDKENNVFWKIRCKYIPASYPGTGDCYTSVVIGSLLQGDSLPIAIDRGTQFITQCIRASYGFKYDTREGILLERMLNILNMPVISSSYEILNNK